MDLDESNIVIADHLDGLGTEELAPYFALIYCYAGKAVLRFNGRKYSMQAGDSTIIVIGRLVEGVDADEDFRVKAIYISPELMTLSTPQQTNYGLRGFVMLFHEPVMHLNEEEQTACQRNFEAFERRYRFREHRFYWESLISVLQCIYFDFYHFHLRIYGEERIPLQAASIVTRFLTMLQQGDYREHRSLGHYADRLCITTKYLSEVVRKTTGVTANHWINMVASLDIARQLRNPLLSISDIAYRFHFSSPSYFGRYVQKYLGTTPTEFRGRKR